MLVALTEKRSVDSQDLKKLQFSTSFSPGEYLDVLIEVLLQHLRKRFDKKLQMLVSVSNKIICSH